MEQYIKKSALVAEIERRIKTNKECMLGLRNLDYYQGKVDALNDTISSLNTLEVKEVEEPVSEDLEEAAEKYAYEICPSIGVANTETELAFKAGAKWQKKKG